MQPKHLMSSGTQRRPIARRDNAAVANLIRTVMPEFGACGPGFAIVDPEVDDMHGAYTHPKARYYVLERDGDIVGGGGFAQLVGADADTCELRKMYFLADARGKGLGASMLDALLTEARAVGFKRCYLETLTGMHAARALYASRGFRQLDAPLGKTGHFGCDQWYARDL
jgi:putative acetyltransferase